MPIYQYECDKCGHEFERPETVSEHNPKKVACPKYKSKRVHQVLGSFFANTSKKS